MKTLRRFLCIPVAALAAVAAGLLWASVFTHASYSEHSVLYSLLGLAPLFFGRLIPVALFVVLSTAIAPAPRLLSVSVYGVLGGVFGWPFGPMYELSAAGSTFYLTEGAGAIAGAGLGMLIGLLIARRKKEPNQRPERNAGATSSSTSESAPGVAHP